MNQCHRIHRRSVLGLGAAAALGASIRPFAGTAQAQQKIAVQVTAHAGNSGRRLAKGGVGVSGHTRLHLSCIYHAGASS